MCHLFRKDLFKAPSSLAIPVVLIFKSIHMFFNSLPLVDWTMGSIILGLFLIVCAAIIAVVMNMMNSGKNKQS